MKALTVQQPWATLIVGGYKRIETRTRDTKFRGTLAIHAGKSLPCRLGEVRHYGPDFWVERDRSGLLLRSTRLAWPYRLPLGAVVGTAILFQTRSTDSLEYKPPADEIPLGDHSPGRWGWYLESARRIKPTACNGALGLWNLPEDVAASIFAQMERAS